ncbi:MAG TPA: M20/M25/M40 family metallo-hydrolase [Ilumatobacteraceae bacterium]|nr:M20/M25/M40 family metallo-hydrolase [Ilumatobacteraceae bacterium]
MNSDQSIDRLWTLFQQVIALDTSPGEGHHRVASDDPRLSAFIDKIARPELENLGASTTTDSMGNLIATFGDRTGDELLLIAYPATHHGNKMADPLHARVVVVDDHNYWAGQGASEGKGPFVSLIDALARSRQDGIELGGRVIVAVSTEGSSTNDSSTVMFDEMSQLPAAAALIIGTENKIALGHRGRADIIVTTTGIARHSSVSAGLPNLIADICEAQQRVVSFADRWTAGSPEGGLRSITPYRLVCGPVAPHTMPERCELALDCRFLPGDDVLQLRDHIASAINDDQVEVKLGPVMLPAETDATSRLVARFIEAAQSAGTAATTFTPPWTFDAGAASIRGIPVILFGPSSNNLGAIDATDAVDAEMLTQASAILSNVISSWTS